MHFLPVQNFSDFPTQAPTPLLACNFLHRKRKKNYDGRVIVVMLIRKPLSERWCKERENKIHEKTFMAIEWIKHYIVLKLCSFR